MFLSLTETSLWLQLSSQFHVDLAVEEETLAQVNIRVDNWGMDGLRVIVKCKLDMAHGKMVKTDQLINI